MEFFLQCCVLVDKSYQGLAQDIHAIHPTKARPNQNQEKILYVIMITLHFSCAKLIWVEFLSRFVIQDAKLKKNREENVVNVNGKTSLLITVLVRKSH
jgi:hypothetical protein